MHEKPSIRQEVTHSLLMTHRPDNWRTFWVGLVTTVVLGVIILGVLVALGKDVPWDFVGIAFGVGIPAMVLFQAVSMKRRKR